MCKGKKIYAKIQKMITDWAAEPVDRTENKMKDIREAKAFRSQCQNKSVKIWEEELIVGCSGSKMRGGIICADTCWSVFDDERDDQ